MAVKTTVTFGDGQGIGFCINMSTSGFYFIFLLLDDLPCERFSVGLSICKVPKIGFTL